MSAIFKETILKENTKVKELLSNVPGAFNYFEAYKDEQLKGKVFIYKGEKRVDNIDSYMDETVVDYNLNGENWQLAIYI